MRVFITTLGILISIPSVVHGAIIINEVAWMGSNDSANDEWIELHNTASTPMSVDGWTLQDGMNLMISLAGIIGAGEYAVLERTDDTSAPGSAFLIYAGALPNTGATLTLRSETGSIEDQVAGGENWESIGGDNTTKETAQYTTSGWVTGTPTPNAENVTEGSVPEDADDTNIQDTNESEKTTASQKKDTSESKKDTGMKLVLPDVTLELELSAPERAYVHQPVTFRVEADGISDKLLDSVTCQLNFGDLATSGGKEVVHVYDYAGTYVVMVECGYARHSAMTRHEITVLPVQLQVTHTDEGDVLIHNNAPYEVDISGYRIRGAKTVEIPPHTVLLPRATLAVPSHLLGSTVLAALFDQKQTLVASTLSGRTDQEAELAELAVVAPPAIPLSDPTQNAFGFSVREDPEDSAETVPVVAQAMTATLEDVSNEEVSMNLTNQSASVAASESRIPQDAYPYLGLIGVLFVGLVAVYAGKGRKDI